MYLSIFGPKFRNQQDEAEYIKRKATVKAPITYVDFQNYCLKVGRLGIYIHLQYSMANTRRKK